MINDMTLAFDEPAYRLTNEVNHFEDLGLDWIQDLQFIEYPGYMGYHLVVNEPFEHPDPLIYKAYLDVVKYIDYPVTDNSWPVMSRKMLDTLLSVGSFPHRAIPVAVVDWRVQPEDWYDSSGKLRREIALWNYVAVQLTESLDILDYSKSEFIRSKDEPEKIRVITKHVFNTPPGGFPPLFRIRDFFTLFVSAKARAALKRAGITGPRFISLKGFQKGAGDFTDVPIVVPE